VFLKRAKAKLKLQLDKYEFLKKEANFLGDIVTSDGIKPNPIKVKAIVSYPIPTKVRDYSFPWINRILSEIYSKLRRQSKTHDQLLKKEVKIDTQKLEYIEAFEKMMALIIRDPILQLPDFEKKFVLTTDASNLAFGTVLSQNDHPISFISRTLNDHELNCSAIEQELLARATVSHC